MDSVQSMASSSSSTVPSSRGTSRFISQTEMEMESAKARHWSQLDYSTTDSELSAESNMKYFALLKEDPQWARFFTDFEALEVGEKISGGAQADIYEARNRCDGPFDLVVKVMKGDVPLKAFQAQWPVGMLCARSKYKHLFDLPLITILGGTVLRDERLRGRFAFVMYRRWGDLRLLIDRRMEHDRSIPGPFPVDQAIHLMSSIAGDMDVLHNKHDIIHRDLKASNVLVWGEFGEDMSLIAIPNRVEKIGSVVADFECSVGVMGTWFWMAPETLEQLKGGVPSSEVRLTRESDVYSYGMTCYEIVTGSTPYEGLEFMDALSQILQGRCPELPHDLPGFVKNIIVSCWHSDPLERPSFSSICMALKEKRGPNPMCVVVDNIYRSNASVVKVEKWNNPRVLTLLEVMRTLMDMDLSILKACESSSIGIIMQYLEVMDCEGQKVVKDESIANIKKALCLPRSLPLMHHMECTSASLKMTLDGNASFQMYVIEVITEYSVGVIQFVLTLLAASNFQVLSLECGTCKSRLECVICVRGARMCDLLWELRYDIVCPLIPIGLFKIMVQKGFDENSMYIHLQNLRSIDLTRPRKLPNTRVHLKKESREGVHSTKVILCLENGKLLADVSKYMVSKEYKIVQASILSPLFLGNQKTDINIREFGEDERRKISRFLDVANDYRCLGGNMELIFSGPNQVVYGDLMTSLYESGLIVSGGQVYREIGTRLSDPSGDLMYFITKKSSGDLMNFNTKKPTGAGYYISMMPF